ncbi:hypothetical protein MtrunA17_Chr4g0058661 [Medicago truncatula]|uniref:Uncharacterized protein n=1 Tax=Medicago truncatula TaxID=3880 RepID=A0A396ID23_MEDTR|nr:hypothetical protein MtrunA17_Chr4g0058661 [Medicago truncatula]
MIVLLVMFVFIVLHGQYLELCTLLLMPKSFEDNALEIYPHVTY